MSIPTDHYELVELLESASPQEFNALRDRVLEQCPPDVDGERLFQLASDEAIHNMNCAVSRSGLREGIRQLVVNIDYATSHLNELTYTLHDDDYTGTAAGDVRGLLTDLGRHARALSALNEQILRGNGNAPADGVR